MKINRRAFLTSNLALGSAALSASGLSKIAHAAAGEDYRALVCIFMFGGNDANNMVVPRDPADWNQYAAPRGGLAIPRDQLLSIKPTNVQGREFGLHPAMTGLQAVFNQGKAAIVANVGTLAQPLTQAQYRSNGLRPTNLFSHSDQQSLWHTSAADNSVRTGWGGRAGEKMMSLNQSGNLTTCLSVGGNAAFLNGDSIRPFPISPSGRFGLDFADGNSDTKSLAAGLQKMIGESRSNLMDSTWLEIINGALANQKKFSDGLSGAAPFTTVFPDTGLADALKMIARLISVRATFGAKRQVFFAGIGGFDTHGEDQLQRQNELLGEISGAMSAFYNATVELGLAENVTTFTGSDFSRTFATNGRGTDHAWGGHHFVMGGAVNGNAMYGKFPTLVVGGPDDAESGSWIPTTSVDQYAATMASWFGVSSADLNAIFPNLNRFSTASLGFLR
jgi:uncharacterized protein (DUF1501 family)